MIRIDRVPLPQFIQSRALRGVPFPQVSGLRHRTAFTKQLAFKHDTATIEELKDGRGKGTILGRRRAENAGESGPKRIIVTMVFRPRSYQQASQRPCQSGQAR